MVLGIEPRALCMLGKLSTTKLHPGLIASFYEVPTMSQALVLALTGSLLTSEQPAL